VGRLAVQVEAMNLDRVDSGASSSASSCGSIPEHMRHIVVPQLGPRDVHPYHAAATPSKAAFKASPHYPVVMTTNPMVAEQVSGDYCARCICEGGAWVTHCPRVCPSHHLQATHTPLPRPDAAPRC
jgi:hypothetical protein